MQTLTPLAQSLALRDAQDVLYVLTVQWPDGPAHYAHRREALSDALARPDLIEPGVLKADPPALGGRSRPWVRKTLRMALAPGIAADPDSLRSRLACRDIEGLAVDWGIVFLDADRAAGLGDRVVLFHGRIEQAVVYRNRIEIECIDELSALARRDFDSPLSPDDTPERDAEIVGRNLPWVFGCIENLRLAPWRSGIPFSLARQAYVEDSRIYLESTDNLPDAGAVQVGDEVLEYAAVDRAAHTIGTAAAPLTRTEPAWHLPGAQGRLVPDESFQWIVAGHDCLSVDDLRADGRPLDASDYAVVDETWRNRSLQKVVMARWPAEVIYDAQPRTSTCRTRDTPGVWTLDSATSATDGACAIDADPLVSAAQVDETHPLLEVAWTGPTSHGLRRHGILAGARLFVRFRASTQWESDSQLRIVFAPADGPELETVVPRPRPGVAGDGWGPLETVVDLTAFLNANGGWDLLDYVAGHSFHVRIEFDASSDPTVFDIYDLAFEFSYYPRKRVEMAGHLTADVDGMHQAGVAVENPAHIARIVLTDPLGFDLPESAIDDASFAAAAAQFDALNYRFSNVLTMPATCGDILAGLLFEARARIVASGGALRLWVDTGDASLETPEMQFDAANILRGDSLAVRRDSNDRFLETLRLYFGRDFSKHPADDERAQYTSRRLAPFADSRAPGAQLAKRLDWHNHGLEAVAADLAAVLLARHGRRRERLTLAAPLAAAALEPGDCTALSDAHFPLLLEQGRVQSFDIEEPHLVLLDIDFPIEGVVCWRHDDDTFIRHTGAGRYVEFWVEGWLVARIDRTGEMALTGELREHIELTATPDEPIAFDPATDRLFFCTGAPGAWTAGFAIDAAGNLLVRGVLAENSPRPDIVAEQCCLATTACFAKAVEGAWPAIVYDAATEQVDLLGELAESRPIY